MNEEFIKEINQAIINRENPPKSKKTDIAARLSVAIHCFESTALDLLNDQKPNPTSNKINKSMQTKAINYVNYYCNTQKEMLIEVCREKNVSV